jgi:hypothetical protein
MTNEHLEFIKDYPIDELIEWTDNPRKNDKAVPKLAELLKKHKFINPIIIDQNKIIRAGHTRLLSARKMGITKVPVIKVNFDNEEQAISYSIMDNQSATWSEWETDLLSKSLDHLKDVNYEFDFSEFDKILKQIELPEGLQEEPEAFQGIVAVLKIKHEVSDVVIGKINKLVEDYGIEADFS